MQKKAPNRTNPKKPLTPAEQERRQLRRGLPFVSRKVHFGVWVYRNKYGLTFLVLIFITLFFLFVSIKIDLTTITLTNGVMLESVEVEEELVEEPKESKEQQEMESLEKRYYESVQNRSANRSDKFDSGLKDDRGTDAEELYKEAQAVQDRLRAAQQSYKDGLKNEPTIPVSKPAPKSSQNNSDTDDLQSNVKGNVTVSYELDGRRATYLPVPAYKCEEGGEVVVSITVNHSGVVTSASVAKSTSRGGSCINDTAVSFAKQSHFQADSSWDDKHKGTITYIFLNQ